MKRFAAFVAPALLMGALITISAPLLAQNTLNLIGAIPMELKKGQSITLTAIATQGNAAAKTTTIQSNILFDNPVFTVTYAGADIAGVTENYLRNNQNFTIPSGTHSGKQLNRSTLGILGPDGEGGGVTLPAGTVYGTYTFTVKMDAPLFIGASKSKFGHSNAILTTGLIADYRSIMTTASPSSTTTAFGSGSIREVNIVPGPSSLAVFAMGGLAPVLALIRRRRATK